MLKFVADQRNEGHYNDEASQPDTEESGDELD